jgi:conjugative transposon TraM protein
MNQMKKHVNPRKKKMLLFLPVLVIPLVTLFFYSLRGKGPTPHLTTNPAKGLNLQLPDANLKEETLLDKLSFYEKAEKDSAKLEEWMRSDPYYKEKETGAYETDELEAMTETTASKYGQRLHVSPYDVEQQRPEEELMKKLARLQKEIDHPSTTTKERTLQTDQAFVQSGEMDRLQTMMEMMQTKTEEDPEMKQLSTVMDKILDVQHPQRVKERLKEQPVTGKQFLQVTSRAANDTAITGFYGMEQINTKQFDNAIRVVVHEQQVLVNGAILKLRLLQDLFIGNDKIPAGNFLCGVVQLQGERLEIDITSIRSGHSLYEVKLEIYDMDGLPGIHIPGAITRDVAKQSADNSLQLMELTTMDPSLKTQAAAAGINAAKTLLSRKTKVVKVMVKPGYQLLIKNKTENK